MELIASLFCHVSESIPEAEIQRELQRQHDILAQNADHSRAAWVRGYYSDNGKLRPQHTHPLWKGIPIVA